MAEAEPVVPLLLIDECTKEFTKLSGRTRLTKLVFLAQKEEPQSVRGLGSKVYTFEPWNYGPFSAPLLADLDRLADRGLIEVNERVLDSRGDVVEHIYHITPKGARLVEKLEDQTAVANIRSVARKYGGMTRNQLVSYVYRKYPDEVAG